jgi:hypothetical protein
MIPNEEHLSIVCELASIEQEPQKLSKLIEEIFKLLDEREPRVYKAATGSDPK